MEVIGIAASVAGLIQLTMKLAELGSIYIAEVKSFKEDVQRLTDNIDSFSKTLCKLQKHVNDSNPSSPDFKDLPVEIARCQSELTGLRNRLEGHRQKKHRFSFTPIKRSLTWPLKTKENNEIIERLDRHMDNFNMVMTMATYSVAKVMETQVDAIKRETTSAYLTVQDLGHHVRAGSIAQSLREEREEESRAKMERKQVLAWLFSLPFDTKHTEISNRRQQHTGNWLLESTEFTTWDLGNAQILWGSGIPGAGKTFLSSRVIDYFLTQPEVENCGLAYIYFDYREQNIQTPIDVLSSLIKQLALHQDCVPGKLQKLYDELERREGKPSIQQLSDVIMSLLTSFNRVHLVFDAMDECNITHRTVLLPLLHRMRDAGAYIFVTSRDYPQDIRVSFRSVPHIRLVPTDGDIKNYVLGKINNTVKIKSLIARQGPHSDLQSDIVSELIASANGMFLLVHFHIEYLCAQISVKQLRSALEALRLSAKVSAGAENPLDATYDRVMETIKRKALPSRDLAMNILTWLTAGYRTFTVGEIRVAASLIPGQGTLDEGEDLPDHETMLDVCAGLVTIDEVSNSIRLSHLTVHDYLVRNAAMSTPKAHENIASICSTYLSLDVFADGVCQSMKSLDDRLATYPLLEYVVTNMSAHLQHCEEGPASAIITSLHKSATSTCVWLQSSFYLRRRRITNDRYLRSNFNEVPPLLHFVAFTSNHEVLLRLLKDSPDVSTTTSAGETVLHWAARSGDIEVMRILIDNHADPRRQDKDGRTALYVAAGVGNSVAVQMLMDVGVSSTTPTNYGSTPLAAAAALGHQEVVCLLLQNGASVSSVDDEGGTPLFMASWAGHEPVVRTLLENGANVDAADNDGDTPLTRAATDGHEAVVRILLENGADVTSANKNGETALLLSTVWGHEATAKTLLDHGAHPSVPDNDGYSSVHEAARVGGAGTLSLLLAKSGDSHTLLDKQGRTPLFYAVERSNVAFTELLLSHGADPTVIDPQGITPLMVAEGCGNVAAIELLTQGLKVWSKAQGQQVLGSAA